MTAANKLGDWREVRLSEICERTELATPERWPDKPFCYVDVSSVSNETFRITQPKEILGKDAPSRARKLIHRNDVIFATVRPSLQRVALVPPNLDGQICSTGFCVLRSKPDLLDPLFLYFYLLTEKIRRTVESLQDGATYPAIRDSDLLEQSVCLPSIPEQRAIVRVIDTVRQAKEARQHELTLERERKAALMGYLFTHGIRGEPTKLTEIGEIPESWKLTTLGELCEDDLGLIQTGPFGSQLHASDYIHSGVPVVNPTHLLVNGIETGRLPHISQELAHSLSRHYLCEGDILISRRGDFSRFAFIASHQAGWLCGTGCLLVRLANPDIDNYFLAVSMSLEPIQNYLRQAAVGTIMPNLNTRILAEMPVMLPDVEEQRRIAAVVRACESKIAALEVEEPLLGELFRTMLEDLMTRRLPTVSQIEEHQAQ